MRRWLFNLTAAVSLVLGAVALAGAVRTQFVSEGCTYQRAVERPTGRVVVTNVRTTSAEGSLILARATATADAAELRASQAKPTEGWSYGRTRSPRSGVAFGRFEWHQSRVGTGGGQETAGIAVPWWLVAAVCGVLPGIWTVRVVRVSRRARAGRCPTCRYDVRATPDRCPECGAVPRQPPHNPPMQRLC